MSERPTNPPSGLTSGDPLRPEGAEPPRERAVPPPSEEAAQDRERATPPRPAAETGYAPPRPAGDTGHAPPRPAGDTGYAPPRPAGDTGYASPRPAGDTGHASPRPAGDAGYAPPRPAAEPFGGYTSAPPPGAFGGETLAVGPGFAPGALQLAGWWSRVGAHLIDLLIITAGGLLLLIVFGAVFSAGFFASEEAGVVSLIIGLMLAFICFAIVALLYAPWMMARTNGRTLGRMAMGIRVVRANGKPVTFGWAMVREVAVKWLLIGAVASSFTFGLAWLLDVLWPLWDEENRTLHDMVVDSRVVRD